MIHTLCDTCGEEEKMVSKTENMPANEIESNSRLIRCSCQRKTVRSSSALALGRQVVQNDGIACDVA